MYNWLPMIREVIMDDIQNDVWTRPLDQLKAVATEDTDVKQGAYISKDIDVAVTSPARNVTKADTDGAAGTFTSVKASWTKIYQDTTIEVHGIDISQSNGDGPSVRNLIARTIKKEMPHLLQLVFDNIYAQWKLDLTTSGTYGSSSALSRVTYPTLALYNETTSTTITPGLVRAMIHTTRLNKAVLPKSEYQIIMEGAVKYKFDPQVAQLHSWVVNGQAGQSIDGGWQAIGNFEGCPLYEPQGMTTGDVFFGPKQYFMYQEHMPLTPREVYSGRNSIKIIFDTGVNGWVENVGKCGMQTNKS